MATLQVKGIDEQLYKALGARASTNGRSISQEVVMMIRESLAKPSADLRASTDAILELMGSWEDDRSARQIATDLRKNRRSRHKSLVDESFD